MSAPLLLITKSSFPSKPSCEITFFTPANGLLVQKIILNPCFVFSLIVLIVILIFYVIGTLVVEILQKELEEKNSEDSQETEDSAQEDSDEPEKKEEAVEFSFDEDEGE